MKTKDRVTIIEDAVEQLAEVCADNQRLIDHQKVRIAALEVKEEERRVILGRIRMEWGAFNRKFDQFKIANSKRIDGVANRLSRLIDAIRGIRFRVDV